MQRFKSVYFADHPGANSKQRNLKLAFGPSDIELFNAVRTLTSEDIRRLLQCSSLCELKSLARGAGTSVNSYSIERLRSAAIPGNHKQEMSTVQEGPGVYLFNPVQATYRGGIAEPLHDWYPYLESYSPRFVDSVLSTYAPTATRLLDPFAGMGTTPLTAALSNRMGFYCEINPVLQFLIETKSRVLTSSELERPLMASRIESLACELESSVHIHDPDNRLNETYSACFGTSEFFPPETYETCLRLRSWLDNINCEDPSIGAVASVAVMASLVPCSNMIRRGDLRFRKGEELRRIKSNLTSEVCRRLRSFARDLQGLRSIEKAPVFVASDAKRLSSVPSLEFDAVVTSPPYLNGTNYYRNTKIELWFLRALSSARELSEFRYHTVTAGINDVTTRKNGVPVSRDVERVIRQLSERAYDRRIPTMVASYFTDMKRVFEGLLHHAKPSSKLVVDIGDSSYAGVQVDTPGILADLLREDGWEVGNEETLRQRLSRNGQPLRQALIIATAPPRARSTLEGKRRQRPKWESFKATLPHQKGDFAKRNWGSPLHSLCSYPGKLKPSLAHHLVRSFTSPGDRLLDPFGGVGTLAYEAALYGVEAWSFDISPVAIPVAAAKLRPIRPDECIGVLDELSNYIQIHSATNEERMEAESIQFNGQLPDYYHPRTLDEILLARRYFSENSPVNGGAAVVLACLLHILHGNRPYALSRRSHPITPFSPSGKVEYKSLNQKLAKKLARTLAVTHTGEFVSGTSLFQDATGCWPLDIDQLDAVITSPPFFDSTRFHLANWIRLWFAGWSREDFRRRPLAFVEEQQREGFDVYKPVIRQARERLKPGGVCVFHLGKSRKCDMSNEIAEIARPWFRNIEIFSEDVTHCETHGIRDKGSVVEHKYLLLS